MRSFRRDRQGLAEIVGTLMLVVIVVAAATAFSFFVAAYQKQLQAEETLNHDRSLEAVNVIVISELPCSSTVCDTPCTGCFANVTITVASLDVNPITVTGLFLDQHPVVNYTMEFNGATLTPCYNGSSRNNSTFGLIPCQPVNLPALAEAQLIFNLDNNKTHTAFWAFGGSFSSLFPTSYIALQILTGLGNEFSGSFVPPVAIAAITYVSGTPVLDATTSYQPSGNATIISWEWDVTSPLGCHNDTTAPCGPLSGQEAELGAALTPTDNYSISLVVLNSYGLTGSATIQYMAP
ncbi:MAG TPA: hypothetical protein VN819_04195 [Thermoplasmata archaeon]|nr:hypothetical protein [Thermoplasmata archaeon]